MRIGKWNRVMNRLSVKLVYDYMIERNDLDSYTEFEKVMEQHSPLYWHVTVDENSCKSSDPKQVRREWVTALESRVSNLFRY